MRQKDKTTLVVIFLGFLVMCLACSGGDKAAVATAGSIQDSSVTTAKRESDAARNMHAEQVVVPTPTPVVMHEIHSASFPAAEYQGGEK